MPSRVSSRKIIITTSNKIHNKIDQNFFCSSVAKKESSSALAGASERVLTRNLMTHVREAFTTVHTRHFTSLSSVGSADIIVICKHFRFSSPFPFHPSLCLTSIDSFGQTTTSHTQQFHVPISWDKSLHSLSRSMEKSSSCRKYVGECRRFCWKCELNPLHTELLPSHSRWWWCEQNGFD